LLIHVAVPVPSLDLLTYAVPGDRPGPAVGGRVVVPLGSRVVTGIVVAVGVGAPPGDVKEVRTILDRDAFVPPEIVALAQWTAEYYACGVGDAIPMLLPPMARGARVDAHKTRRVAAITAAGLDAIGAATVKQREALELLAGSPDGIATGDLARRGIQAAVVSRLARQGYVSLRQVRIDRDPFDGVLEEPREGTDHPPVDARSREGERRLTPEQEGAVARLRTLAAGGAFKVALLHGVTGSGKTEVYLRLAAAVRAGGRSVLMLVPEIALTPAVAAEFRAAFGGRVAIQHSGLSDGERHDQWQRIRRGEVAVVVGTRSAVFAPLERVGLIIVDEEHDASYKQEESPRYNGRDVAIVRAQRAGALVVLGSATPSMESYHNAMTGKYEIGRAHV